MEAVVHTSPCPGVDDRVVLGPVVIPMTEFLALVEHVLTSSPLRKEDPRLALVERVRIAATCCGTPGRGGSIKFSEALAVA